MLSTRGSNGSSPRWAADGDRWASARGVVRPAAAGRTGLSRTVIVMSPRRRSVVTVALAAIVGLAGCHPGQDLVSGPEAIEVTGDFGVRPTVTFDAPLSIKERSVTVVIDGEGPALAPGAPILIDWLAIDGTTGAELETTWQTAPDVFAFTAESLGDELYAAVAASGTNDRVLLIEPVSSASGVPGSRVVVADVRAARAQGTPVPPAAGLPVVTLADDGAPIVTFPGTAPPAERVEQLLIKGAGAQVEADSTLIVQYSVVQWSDGAVRVTTWGAGSLPQTLELETAIPGLSQGLLDHTVGSQVLLVVPPAEATGDDTLVFVIDILAVVHEPGAATASPTPSGSESVSPEPSGTVQAPTDG